ncbi:urease accessory protein UreD [Streptomyces carpaticus]|uniref:urease accessory protein UreD n=1 Tax=Streptomyces carpaticus TaxID=285558 RepID=UPI0031F7D191
MRVTARARITAAPGGRLPLLAGEGPLALRRTRAREPGWAQVTTVGAMSGPLGGDRLRLTVTVLPGAALRVTSAAAMVALPGRDGAQARYDTVLTVGEGGVLHWLPEPVISAAGSALRMTTRVELAAGAHLVLREQLVLGRADEPTGRLTTRLTVRRAGRPLLDQELDIGPGAPGWDAGAVLGGHRAVGQVLVVDPERMNEPVAVALPGPAAVLAPLPGPGALATVLAPDGLALSRQLTGIAERMTSGARREPVAV